MVLSGSYQFIDEKDEKMTPLKAIRTKCLECAGSLISVGKCRQNGCPLFLYRFGHNPARRGIGGGLSNFKKKVPTQVGAFCKKRAL
ncbi:MAG: hypothetical protein WC510_01995 [Candidatus Omnitrophota bacterium]